MRQLDSLLTDGTEEQQRLAQLMMSLTEELETLNLLDAGILELTAEDDLEAEI